MSSSFLFVVLKYLDHAPRVGSRSETNISSESGVRKAEIPFQPAFCSTPGSPIKRARDLWPGKALFMRLA